MQKKFKNECRNCCLLWIKYFDISKTVKTTKACTSNNLTHTVNYYSKKKIFRKKKCKTEQWVQDITVPYFNKYVKSNQYVEIIKTFYEKLLIKTKERFQRN